MRSADSDFRNCLGVAKLLRSSVTLVFAFYDEVEFFVSDFKFAFALVHAEAAAVIVFFVAFTAAFSLAAKRLLEILLIFISVYIRSFHKSFSLVR